MHAARSGHRQNGAATDGGDLHAPSAEKQDSTVRQAVGLKSCAGRARPDDPVLCQDDISQPREQVPGVPRITGVRPFGEYQLRGA